MYYPVEITQSQEVIISEVSIDKGQFEKQKNLGLSSKAKNVFSIKKQKSATKQPTVIEIKFAEESTLNQITTNFFTQQVTDVNLFFSNNGFSWFRISIKTLEIKKDSTILRLPLIRCKYLQMVINSTKLPDTISGWISKKVDLKFESSSHKDRLWIPENLTDGRDSYGWSSDSKKNMQDEFVIVDIGDNYHIQEIALKSTKETPTLFPQSFIIELSNDQKSWQAVIQEGNFLVAPLSWYRWSDLYFGARYIRIRMLDAKKQKQYHILELGIFALPENEVAPLEKFSNTNLQNFHEGTEATLGFVRYAEHNGVHPLRAIQSNDPRVREATTLYHGINRIAKDQEVAPMVVLQSNDSRITPATEEKEGIIRLAKDREVMKGATVQSNDSRLRISTTKYPGIVQLAENQISTSGYAVQANDDRLRNASTTWSGIIQLARHGESHKDRVVSSDDPRLAEGNEELKGRVRFAKDKGVEPMTAVQGNDSRLLLATEKKNGLVRFAKHNQKEAILAVQANDPRLEDTREALPHKHDYAPQKHSFNSHEGSLNINIDQADTNKKYSYNLAVLKSFPLSVKNTKGPSAAFQGGVVIEGNHKEAAIQAFSKTNPGSKIKSKNEPGGVFFSEKNYALHLPLELDELIGSTKSILAEGDALFRRNLFFEHGLSVAISWPLFSDEHFVDGDLLTIQENLICKLKSNHQPFVGVFVKNPSFCLSQTTSKENLIKIAIFGITLIRIKGKVNSGDWIGYLDSEPGVGQRISQVQKQHSFAIAMESSGKETVKLISCLLRR